MISQKRIDANRANALKSTGPRSSEGKAKVARNALNHGMTAKVYPTLPGDDPGAYAAELDRWNRVYGPADRAGRDLVDRACNAAWRLRRIAEINAAGAADRADGELEDVRTASLRLRYEQEALRTLRKTLPGLQKMVVDQYTSRFHADAAVLAKRRRTVGGRA